MISDYMPFILFTLIVVIVIQAVERYFTVSQFNSEKNKLIDELSKAIKAVISKNANDYVMTTSIDKVSTEEKPKINTDLIPEDELTDDEFMEAIDKRTKK